MAKTANPDRKNRPKVVLVYRAMIEEKGKILLIKRVPVDRVNSNKWELPGGKLEAGQDVVNAIEREVLEETGFVVVPIDKVVYLHNEIISTKKYRGMPYIVLVGRARLVGGAIRLSEEHDEFKWVTCDEALKYDLTPESRGAISVLSRNG